MEAPATADAIREERKKGSKPVKGASKGAAATKEDRTITKVVKMLEGMLEKSKEDGDQDRKIYSKFLCYCNEKKATKTREIGELAKTIALLEDKIAELKGSNGALSSEAAKLKADIFDNEEEQAKLTQIRADEKADYDAFKEDSETAIAAMTEAIATLAEIGADQTLGEAAADHKQFMAGYSSLQTKKDKMFEQLVGLLKGPNAELAAFIDAAPTPSASSTCAVL